MGSQRIRLWLSACTLIQSTERGLPWRLSGKESACQAGDSSYIPGSGRSPREGKGNPLQEASLENPMDREAWQDIVQWSLIESDTDLARKAQKSTGFRVRCGFRSRLFYFLTVRP